MERIQKIKAFLNLDDAKTEIGTMVENQGKIYFKYHPDFILCGLEISPFKMKLSNAILAPKETHFEGLFGVFSDSIPDGWGRLLLDRKLLSMGVNLNDITPLDRLAYIDKNSVGAISYEPEYVNSYTNFNAVDLDQISNEIETVLSGTSEDVIEELFKLGGSSGGARPKILIGFNPNTKELLYGKSDLPEGFEHWIVKFPSSNDLADIALIEYTYNQMAQAAGIEVNEFRLFKSKKGKYFFGSKRFDRIHNKKLHLHSVAGLLHDNFRMSTLDYGHIMDCAFTLEKDFNAFIKVLRLATFNVLAHNRDDHSKNFSFLMDKNGYWKLAPAYDLTFSNSSYGFHSTTVAGESKNPTLEHLTVLAKHFGIKNPNPIFEEVKGAISQFGILGSNNGISTDSMKLISGSLRFK
ncbi:type II toxin-antitoxin system HipA family toxin [Flavobacterium gawalongense]|uniref:Type II toxin-antitoxin system HipA family toxin n=1 Tax=Flavobacterium gawalongense TaxID=2594432 RepID=A0A553BWR3_9FLAO|nr:type II toxin-antitoxin system HipA family toxin [Flavobacterium gawalongense]TRX01189.1 type II toxin-antitoxin system HipA family toxin [Flavobacterium gawalongense]TRX05286.1 type II toxin-antitoxin system HipA family toxin [Flavobacterium gawalongense]TRX12760.1 type II toxin-antitoxin system HipA family toxin [Flavobacterium gawalongense]TRX13105.1 type II toxin-antitoxin system HipA family toxin [Flavobacterium gawalongense]TRX30833.1 type II toxin-antitoxin system HipA family toxin [